MITFDPDRLGARQAELEQLMNAPGFWDDQERAQRLSTEHARVSKRLDTYVRLSSEFADVSPEVLELGIRNEFARRAGFPVQDFVSVFVERSVRQKLRA